MSRYARRAEELSESLCGAAIPRMRRPRRLRRRRTSARAVGQIHYGRTLRERLPEVAKVFAQGVIDFRVVSTIIARTENVADEDGGSGCRDRAPRRQVDEAIRPRSCGIGWICGWPNSTRPRCGCRRRLRTAAMSRSCRPMWGWQASSATSTPPTAPRSISASMRWPPRCVTTIRAPVSSAALMRRGQ
jgi:hypothetical protein